ncbi:helix-turn-helix domain-containing protein [Tersicoccus sp. MR15.9]|uniref:helix-turn-helix domain-containing protein n=1 Tax=Tersicoccus mangrovi TaxID=3121635 RepID=UPI002FE594DD
MQELMGRVTSLDPSVSQSLKVISYFDALVAGGVNLETLVRGAAALSGTVAGMSAPDGTIRVESSGRRLTDDPEPGPAGTWNGVDVDDAARVWLEREGDAHVNDSLVLERLALAVASVRARRLVLPDNALETVVDASRSVADRAAAATRLRLGTSTQVRAVAVAPDVQAPGPSALIATAYGVVRVWIGTARTEIRGGGLGRLGTGIDLATSWRTALAAYRLTDAQTPVIDAESLGALLDAVLAVEARAGELPDVRSLAALDPHTRSVLAMLAHAESVRSAAASLGMHHSTLQSRHEAFSRDLGYDPRTAVGRARFQVASMLLQLSAG